MKDDIKTKIIYLIFMAPTILLIVICLAAPAGETIPISGLYAGAHMFLVVLWAVLGSIVLAIICSRFLSVLFIKSKHLVLAKYEDGYIKTEKTEFSFKKFASRGVFCFLFTLGILIVLLDGFNIKPSLYVTEFTYKRAERTGVPLEYEINFMMSFLFLILPISVGIFSIGWAIEDAGLIHYYLPNEETNELFEIEPIFVRYNSYIKGYAGLTSIFFYVSLIYFFATRDLAMENILASLILFMVMIVFIWSLMFPAYMIYLKRSKDYMRKNLQEHPRITKSDYKPL